MQRRFDPCPTAAARLAVGLAAASLALGALAVGVGVLVPGSAQAQAGPPAMPEDDGLDAAIEHQSHGHPDQAAQVLARLAEDGHVVAMERLALMHWYGETLYGSGPWRREVGAGWFERAARQGSVLGRYMLGVVRRAGVLPSPVARSQGFPMP